MADPRRDPNKPVGKLRKLLKKFSSDPRPEDVHSLRTLTKRIEAIAVELSLQEKRAGQRCLTHLSPLRKAAGATRDADILIKNLIAISGDQQGEGSLILVEHLAQRRRRYSRRLGKMVQANREQVRRDLKRLGRLIRKEGKFGLPSMTALQIRAAEIENWPRLSEANLHQFRKRVKEFRYMLQLAPDRNQRQMAAMDKVKDESGEWHDWMLLAEIAEEVLDSERDGSLLKAIRVERARRLHLALAAARELCGANHL